MLTCFYGAEPTTLSFAKCLPDAATCTSTGPARSRWSVLLVAGIIVALIAGCDGLGSAEHRATAIANSSNAGQAQSQSGLHLSPGAFTEIDLHFKPVSVPTGESFTMSMTGTNDEREIARVTHRNPKDKELALSAEFGSFDVQSVVVRYRVHDTVVQTDTLAVADPGNRVPVGRSSEEPTSWHYKEVGDQVIVVVDYDGDESKNVWAQGQKASGDNSSSFRKTTIDPAYDASPVQCTHVAFVVSGVSSSIEPRGVKMHGAADEISFVEKQFK